MFYSRITFSFISYSIYGLFFLHNMSSSISVNQLSHVAVDRAHLWGRLIVACLVDTLTLGGNKWWTSSMTATCFQVG